VLSNQSIICVVVISVVQLSLIIIFTKNIFTK